MNNTNTINQSNSVPNVHLKRILYVTTDDFDLKRVIIQTKTLKNHDIKMFDVMYMYGSDDISKIDSTDSLIDKLNLFCKDLAISSNRKGTRINGFNWCNIPLNQQYGSFDVISNIIKQIREKIIEYYKINFSQLNVECQPYEYVKIEMMRNGKMCKIIKLGSKSENNVNSEIKSIEQFNNLLKDYKYNKFVTDSYYKLNSIISFRSCIYHKIDNFALSFSPYAKLMEIQYSKADCIKIIDETEKIVTMNNVLVL